MPDKRQILTGLDIFREGAWKKLKGYRLGLLANQASVDSDLNPAREVIESLLPGRLKALFGPQHGYGGEDQDNMIETEHATDPAFGIPVYSLYSDTREPLPHMLDEIDILIIDLQDIGTRVYTFASTMLNCLKAAAGDRKKVFVLDRPNPIGGDIVEGDLLRRDHYSFVGPFRFPMRHGLTIGEMAGIFNHVFELDADLTIIPMKGWQRNMLWDDTGLTWIMPSPNMPLPDTALVYPGQVMWEGTNVSEGRGTCRPFEIFGAPYMKTEAVKSGLAPVALKGCRLQEFSFRPTFNKWKGKHCRGFLIHVLSPQAFRPYTTSICLLKSVMRRHPKSFRWKAPPYEYEYHKQPIDLIVGDPALRGHLESDEDLSWFQEKWEADRTSFMKWRAPYLIYS